MGILKVLLVNVTNLADEDHFGKSDPYVKFEVLRDGWTGDHTEGTAESTHKSNEQSPEFNEEFDLECEELANHGLGIKVMDDDVGSDEKLGKAFIDFDKEPLEPGVPKEFNVTVDDNWFSKDAVMKLVLTYTE